MEQTFSRFYTPQFVTGRGSISFISTLGKKRIGIVRGGRSYSPELEKVIEAIAEETQALVCCFAKIRNEPNIQDIFQCMETVRDFEPDMILAVGGGSVLDTAKAIHLFYENPEMSFEDSLTPFTPVSYTHLSRGRNVFYWHSPAQNPPYSVHRTRILS